MLRTALAAGTSGSLFGLSGCGRDGTATGGEVDRLVVPTAKTPWLDAYKTVAAEYEKHSGVRVVLREFPYDGLRTQMTNTILSGQDQFDLFQLDESWTGLFYDNGWARPLRDVDPDFTLDDAVIDYDQLPRWSTSARSARADGELMSVPLNGNLTLLIYRRDLYDELGLSVPKTWEELVANGRRAQESGRVAFGNAVRGQATLGGQSISFDIMPLLYSYGADWFSGEGKDWTPVIDSPEAVAATKVYRRLLEIGPPQPQTLGQAEVTAVMQSGRVLQSQLVAASAAELEDIKASNVAGKLGYAPLPAGPEGKRGATTGTWSLAIPANLPPPRAKAALDFLRWLSGAHAQRVFAQAGGIPGRRDVLTPGAEEEAAPGLYAAMRQALPDARRSVRYPFATLMLELVERGLGSIATGEIGVREGLQDMSDGLEKVVRDAGFRT